MKVYAKVKVDKARKLDFLLLDFDTNMALSVRTFNSGTAERNTCSCNVMPLPNIT